MAPEPPEGGQEMPAQFSSSNNDAEPAPMAIDSDDDDFDERQYEGYMPLPLAATEETDMALSSSSSDEEDHFDASEQPVPDPEPSSSGTPPPLDPFGMPPIETADAELAKQVWATPRIGSNIEMNPDKANQVMTAMANFSLPPTSFPEWARNVSEEEWRRQLDKRINGTQINR